MTPESAPVFLLSESLYPTNTQDGHCSDFYHLPVSELHMNEVISVLNNIFFSENVFATLFIKIPLAHTVLLRPQ